MVHFEGFVAAVSLGVVVAAVAAVVAAGGGFLDGSGVWTAIVG